VASCHRRAGRETWWVYDRKTGDTRGDEPFLHHPGGNMSNGDALRRRGAANSSWILFGCNPQMAEKSSLTPIVTRATSKLWTAS